VTLAAAYAFPAYQTVFWNPETAQSVSSKVNDLNFRERAILWVLCILMLWIGIAPASWINLIAPSLRGLVQ
jgi:NADH:ubiquinone oxidoreductase subunit 4 (subunit M)